MVKMDKSSEKRVTKGRNHVFLAALPALMKRPSYTYEASGSTLLIVSNNYHSTIIWRLAGRWRAIVRYYRLQPAVEVF